jgi:hypothetical protein
MPSGPLREVGAGGLSVYLIQTKFAIAVFDRVRYTTAESHPPALGCRSFTLSPPCQGGVRGVFTPHFTQGKSAMNRVGFKPPRCLVVENLSLTPLFKGGGRILTRDSFGRANDSPTRENRYTKDN